MRSVCRTNIRKALRESIEDESFVDINHFWQACIWRDGCGWVAELWNWDAHKSMRTRCIVGCTCMTELINYATDILMGQYASWCEGRQKDTWSRDAFDNACDCIYYGYGRSYWNDCGCADPDAVWEAAMRHMAA